MRQRNLCDECANCVLNVQSLYNCLKSCGIPYAILGTIENNRKIKEGQKQNEHIHKRWLA